jgi:hypothetical protein
MAKATGTKTIEAPVQIQLVHAVRGRTRVRVTPPHLAGYLVRAIEALLGDQPGIQEIRLNEDCGSVVLTYDPELLDLDRLVTVTWEAEESDGTGGVFERLEHAAAAVRGWIEGARAGGDSLLGEVGARWRAGWDQISAVMSFWRANSAVARSARPPQSTPTAAGGLDGDAGDVLAAR